MELFEDITTNIVNNLITAGVFMDLKKAFDTIDHGILYMSHITQYVVYDGISFDYKTIICGIPQGSITFHIIY